MEDRSIVMAVTMEEGAKCSTCGTAEWEWEEDPFAYHPVIHTCIGCQKRALLNNDDTPRPEGSTIRLVDKETAERIERRAAQNERPVRRKGRS